MKNVKLMDKVLVYMWLQIPSNESTAGKKSRFLLSRFLISTSGFLILAEAFQNDHEAACSTALRSASESNEKGGYVSVPCPSQKTQQSTTADRLKFQWRHQIVSDGTRMEQIFPFKVTPLYFAIACWVNLLDFLKSTKIFYKYSTF